MTRQHPWWGLMTSIGVLLPLLCVSVYPRSFFVESDQFIRDNFCWCSTPNLLIPICTALMPRCTVHIYTYIHTSYIYMYIYITYIQKYLTRITQSTKDKSSEASSSMTLGFKICNFQIIFPRVDPKHQAFRGASLTLRSRMTAPVSGPWRWKNKQGSLDGQKKHIQVQRWWWWWWWWWWW